MEKKSFKHNYYPSTNLKIWCIHETSIRFTNKILQKRTKKGYFIWLNIVSDITISMDIQIINLTKSKTKVNMRLENIK